MWEVPSLGVEITQLNNKRKINLYAILDIETTGGKFNEEGMTEIAIYKFDGHTVVDQFISLINPEREIQEFVVKLTGINSKMLRNAPKFFEVAKRIIEITKDCIIVAHNSLFDYRILQIEFSRLGFNFDRNTICTVELSKQLILDEPSYSLGKLVKSLGIPITDRHRANGDALATVQLFKLLLQKDTEKKILQKTIKYFDKRTEKEKIEKILNELPTSQGVFYIHNLKGLIIYMGRGINIKSEVNKLFTKQTKRTLKIQEKTEAISFSKTGNYLFTKLKYYSELDSLSPKYNFKKNIKLSKENFNNDDFIIIEKGREIEENAIILIENNQVTGYGYTNLAYQENNLEILKKVLTPFDNSAISKTIIKNYLKKNNVQKIIRL